MKNEPTPTFKQMVPRWEKQRGNFRKKLLRAVVHLFAWTGMAILYYIAFSFFFDTPLEYRLKQQTKLLSQEYDSLTRRYALIEKVMDNVVERDKNVFNTLFEADPYEFDTKYEKQKWQAREQLLSKSNKELGREFFRKLGTLEKNAGRQLYTLATLELSVDSLSEKLNYIPSIQPVNNKELTLLTTSYGMRIHPFYKSLVAHQGVDYSVGEGTRVFATADATVKNVVTRQTSSGNTVVLDHGNGYETTYSHLSKIYVRRGQRVRRGISSPSPAIRAFRWPPTCITKSRTRECAWTPSTTFSWNWITTNTRKC